MNQKEVIASGRREERSSSRGGDSWRGRRKHRGSSGRGDDGRSSSRRIAYLLLVLVAHVLYIFIGVQDINMNYIRI